MNYHGVHIPKREIAEFCRRHDIRRLALFGSILREDFRLDSDIDVLVVFAPEARVGMFGLTRMQAELSQLLGKKVDLNTPGLLSERFRDEVLRNAEDQYVAA
jgi:predicted nucleotidyltransferase